MADFNWTKKCEEIARETEGMSGRELSKLVLGWQCYSIYWALFYFGGIAREQARACHAYRAWPQPKVTSASSKRSLRSFDATAEASKRTQA
ncbi:unnamed protein product [Anisakis simplex]|uniref:Transmembrane protein n=1 Tax=Anisakis simplex TaxID=6269 RepID=A0A0M3KJD8_ANISI|nr:unnamed protein product [Anisakis simplex]